MRRTIWEKTVRHSRSVVLVAMLLAAGAAQAQSEIIVDNGGPGFSTLGNWPASTAVGGYYGTNYQTHAANGVPPGAIAVDNSDAGFAVTGTWPTSTAVSGYYGSNYQVHAANGVPPAAIAADNPEGSAVGTWPTSTSVGGYYGANYQTHAAGTGTNSFTWTLNVASAGSYEVYARWTAHPNRASNAKYTVTHAGGQSTVAVNQQGNSASWQLLGTYSFDAGAATVSLSDEANGYVIADAVMLQPPGAAPNQATWTLAVPSAGTYGVYARWTAHPNRASDAKFTIAAASGASSVTVNQQQGASGQWNLLGTYGFNAGSATVSLSDQANGYVIADAVMLAPPGTPPNSATWTPSVPAAGSYQVYAWWTANPNRASNATYTVAYSGGTAAVAVNQQTSGGAWNLLGTFNFDSGTGGNVSLSDQANGYVIADAIRLVPLQVQSALYYIVPDHLNTPRLIQDQAGTTVWRNDNTEPFGDSVPNDDPNGSGNHFDFPLRFAGQYFDRETGLAYNWRRDYSAPIGRYIQSDPIGLRGGFNTYAYVGNVPLLAVDPHGLLVTGSWIIPPAFNLEDWGIDSWTFVSPSWSWWGYLKFIRLYGHASGFVNIDVKCVSDEPCSHKEWEIHNHISVDASGSFDVGPNLYALTGGLVLGPWIGGSINIVIAGAVLLQAELHYLQLAEQKAGPVIAAILAGGPTAICLGTDR